MNDQPTTTRPWIDPDEIQILVDRSPGPRDALILGIRFVDEPEPLPLRIAAGIFGVGLVLLFLALAAMGGL